MRKSWIRFIATGCFVTSAFCQSPAATKNATLTTTAIIEMTRSGLPEDIIIAKIRTEPKRLEVTTDDLIALKQAGVADSVIRAMLLGPSAKADAPAPGFSYSAPQDPNDPLAPHDPGIYMMFPARDGERARLVLVERAGPDRRKTGNIFASAITYGIVKMKTVAEISGPHAPLRTTDAKPEFYMYFPPVGNLGAGNNVTSPEQFTLLALDDKKDHREMTVLKSGFTGASFGNDEKMTVRFNAEKIRPYAYRVAPDVELKPGEYAFVAAPGSVMVFDFGVDSR